MTVLLDTSILIDFLRGRSDAVRLVSSLDEVPLSSEICRVELLQGLRPAEFADAEQLLALIDWVPVLEPIARHAGELGRQWRPSHSGIGTSDLIIAASAELLEANLLTLNVRHFPMFRNLVAPY